MALIRYISLITIIHRFDDLEHGVRGEQRFRDIIRDIDYDGFHGCSGENTGNVGVAA